MKAHGVVKSFMENVRPKRGHWEKKKKKRRSIKELGRRLSFPLGPVRILCGAAFVFLSLVTALSL